jgi:hypothetical protein
VLEPDKVTLAVTSLFPHPASIRLAVITTPANRVTVEHRPEVNIILTFPFLLQDFHRNLHRVDFEPRQDKSSLVTSLDCRSSVFEPQGTPTSKGMFWIHGGIL